MGLIILIAFVAVEVKFFVPLQHHYLINLTNLTFFQVDAFTDIPFKGNPAAICLLEHEIPVSLMQQIAIENNLAETAYVLKITNGFGLRWFTPAVEIRLCGHATLASAHILWEKGMVPATETISFHTKSGLLPITKNREWIQMDFPAFSFSKTEIDAEIVEALGIFPKNSMLASDGRLVIEIDNEAQLRSFKPDFSVLKSHDVVIVVTCKSEASSEYDFISRSFTASHGVDEDPVTGSSHCVLAPYWSQKLGKDTLSAFQASARGGALKLQVAGDRVLIQGKAVTVIEGVFRVNI